MAMERGPLPESLWAEVGRRLRAEVGGAGPSKVERFLSPANSVVAGVESVVNDAMDRIPEMLPPGPRRVLFKNEQANLAEAILADLVEVLPFSEWVIEPFRTRDAAKRPDVNDITRRAIEMAIPLHLPTNTRRHLRHRLGK